MSFIAPSTDARPVCHGRSGHGRRPNRCFFVAWAKNPRLGEGWDGRWEGLARVRDREARAERRWGGAYPQIEMLLEARADAPARAEEADGAPAPGRRLTHPLAWALGACVVLAALSLLGAQRADLRPVGLDHLGPRDHAARPEHDRRARRGSRCRCCSPPSSRCSATRPRDLWLVVARAGALAGARRRVPASPGGSAAASPAAWPPPRRSALAPWYVRNAALGNSEGLLVALAARRGRPRTSPATGARRSGSASALRAAAPGGLAVPRRSTALWLLWRRALRGRGRRRRRRRRRSPLWLLPEWWGSGDLLRAAHRAQEPNAERRDLRRQPGRAGAQRRGRRCSPRR